MLGTKCLRGGALIGAGLGAWLSVGPLLSAQTDLDALMREVLAHRDDNWRKLQQYVLDEREQIELRGPSHAPIWGERREYTWYIRDGFFVRSPLTLNGGEIGESERRRYEEDYRRRAEQRERRGGQPAPSETPRDIDGIIRQTRQPQFISSAYFLRFKFEEGKYAFVGHETIDGRDLLRIEYFPARLFTRDQRWTGHQPSPDDKARAVEMERMMNKVSLVTLWIEPNAKQIVKYTFDNVSLDFLPGQWLVNVNDVRASMTMAQPFPDVWLPHDLQFSLGLSIAVGNFDLQYALDYHDYRRADVTTKVTIPGAR
jgi:hypothetical protein